VWACSVVALQVERGALQVVEAARGHQRLLVAGVRGQPRMHMVGHTVLRSGRSDAQVLQRSAGAQADVRVQVLRHTTAALRGLALVRFDEHAAHAVIHLQHQQGGFCLGAWLVAQLQPHGALVRSGFAGRGLHAQAQALAAQRAVGPGKRGGVAVAGLGQIREQFGTLRRVLRVQPARLHVTLRCVAHRVQRPARTGQRRGVAAAGRAVGWAPAASFPGRVAAGGGRIRCAARSSLACAGGRGRPGRRRGRCPCSGPHGLRRMGVAGARNAPRQLQVARFRDTALVQPQHGIGLQ
jgi:hypothetical protein